jgi:hypothetical protein
MNQSHFKKFQSGKTGLGKAMQKAAKPFTRNKPAPVKQKPSPINPNQKTIFNQ